MRPYRRSSAIICLEIRHFDTAFDAAWFEGVKMCHCKSRCFFFFFFIVSASSIPIINFNVQRKIVKMFIIHYLVTSLANLPPDWLMSEIESRNHEIRYSLAFLPGFFFLLSFQVNLGRGGLPVSEFPAGLKIFREAILINNVFTKEWCFFRNVRFVFESPNEHKGPGLLYMTAWLHAWSDEIYIRSINRRRIPSEPSAISI